MFKTQCVLGLLALIVEFAQPWDFAVSHGDLLDFYTDKTKWDTIRFPSHNLTALAYDEVHNMVLFVNKQNNGDSICAHDISSKLHQCLIERNGRNIHGLAFDPATELLFFSDTNERSINSLSLKSGSNTNESLLIKMDNGIPTDLAVDSCRGYIYWINFSRHIFCINTNSPTIERARFNGSGREVIVKLESLSINTTYRLEPHSLTIDQQTQKMYWIEPSKDRIYRVYYTDLKGKNKIELMYVTFDDDKICNPSSNTLAVSKTKLLLATWWSNYAEHIWRSGKLIMGIISDVHTKQTNVGIVANYKIKERIPDNDDCEALKSVEQRISDVPFCVHGMRVVGKSQCKCAPGYIGERCDVSICESYCLHGNCTLNNAGLPNCRCHGAYSGERCEVDACHGFCLNGGSCSLNEQREPVCQCKGGHAGDRCEVSRCVNYCLHGDCTLNDEGLPTCRCKAGYSGERCEVDMCLDYCVNDGECFLDEEDKPTCVCGSSYEGPRCEEVSITITLRKNSDLSDLLSNSA